MSQAMQSVLNNMKKIKAALISVFMISVAMAQSSVFVRHDTTLLKAEECKWIVKTVVNKDQDTGPPKEGSIPGIILDAIEKGILKAMDPQTEQMIPPDKIRTWNMPADTVLTIDSNDIQKINIVRRSVAAEWFSGIRVCSDWYFDIQSGRFTPVIKWADMMINLYSSSGMFIGRRPYLRIYY